MESYIRIEKYIRTNGTRVNTYSMETFNWRYYKRVLMARGYKPSESHEVAILWLESIAMRRRMKG